MAPPAVLAATMGFVRGHDLWRRGAQLGGARRMQKVGNYVVPRTHKRNRKKKRNKEGRWGAQAAAAAAGTPPRAARMVRAVDVLHPESQLRARRRCTTQAPLPWLCRSRVACQHHNAAHSLLLLLLLSPPRPLRLLARRLRRDGAVGERAPPWSWRPRRCRRRSPCRVRRSVLVRPSPFSRSSERFTQ